MTDKRYSGLRHIAESRSRNAKVSEKKMKTKRRGIGLKDSQFPSCQNYYNYRKDFTTPKRRPRIRFNGCYSGDSPNETETQQDIIWDSNSPTQNFNGKVNGKVIEISEIVNRIAPKVEMPKEGDSVLQWIGDNAIPCTPEVRQPRVRKISARQSNVEDLRKLAKLFDINMTRQDKERQQNTTEELNKLNKSKSDGTARTKLPSMPGTSGVTSGSSQAQLEEKELQALFDGPTQHLSGRLSPPSVNCTPEIQPDPVAVSEPGTSSAAVRDAPVDAQKTSVMGFDDDWENDDILNDFFVFEMTQISVPLTVVQKESIAQPKCSSVNLNILAKSNPSVSNGRCVCQQVQKSTVKSSTFTLTLPKGQTSVQSTSSLKPPASAPNQTTQKLLKTSLVVQGKQVVQSSHGSKQTELDKAAKACRSAAQPSTSSKFQGLSKEDLKSLFDSDGLWNDEDDDLLCQACDDIERTSANQEQQRQSMSLAQSTSKTPSSANTIQASTRAFVRSNSVPCSSGSSGFKQTSGVLPTAKGSSAGSGSYHYNQAQNKQVGSALGPEPGSVRATNTPQTILPQSTNVRNGSNSNNSTFKRHLLDSVAITNKVFVSSSATVKCTAAEIERKKQEAIAKRRLRMQAGQKQGGPT